MINEEWEVIVNDRIPSWEIEIYLIKKGYKPQLAHIKDGFIRLVDIKRGELDPHPTLRVNRDVWQALKMALIDKQEREKSTVESELIATKYHLEDMRKLLKLI